MSLVGSMIVRRRDMLPKGGIVKLVVDCARCVYPEHTKPSESGVKLVEEDKRQGKWRPVT